MFRLNNAFYPSSYMLLAHRLFPRKQEINTLVKRGLKDDEFDYHKEYYVPQIKVCALLRPWTSARRF
jgi:hypothetical protein